MEAKEIGMHIAFLRGGKSRRDIAEALSISTSALAMYERGERTPRDAVKKRIAEYFGKTVQEIFFDN